MHYNEYFTQPLCEGIINFLKNECRIEKGFYSQVVGKAKIPSATSSSFIYYVLSKVGALSNAEKQKAISEILSFKVHDDGFYKNAVGVNNDRTTWGTAQACNALIELGCEEKDYLPILDWLCNVQKEDGGWSYNGRADSDSHIMYSLYAVLALKKNINKNREIEECLYKAQNYINCYNAETMSEKTLKLYLIDLLKIRPIKDYEKVKLLLDFNMMIFQDAQDETITESSEEGHFYINFYFNSYYILLRRFVEPDSTISIYLMNQLYGGLKAGKGWANKNSDRSKNIYSWATALSLLVIRFWNEDCRKKGIEISSIIEKLKVITKEDLTMAMFMPKCPLNGGKCNKINEIRRQYNDKNVFLDIPYENKYKTFENQIISTVSNAGLNIVAAKQTQQSNMILCKVCSGIQTCKYGVADISYENLNVPFELGVMYGLGKDCAILKAKDAKQPTDIEGIECIVYENTDELDEQLSNWICDNVSQEV